MVKIAIIGATGYTGAEAIRLLLGHSSAEITMLTAREDKCGPVAAQFPQLHGRDLPDLELLDLDQLVKRADVAFCCLPHKEAMGFVPGALAGGLKVVDFSADYRLHDAALYERVYQVPHSDPANLLNAAFGLPELFRDKIKTARLVANPGCYPTAAALALAPLLQGKRIAPDDIVINAVSGVSGAGRALRQAFHFPEMTENLFAYGIGNHRHLPEIEQILRDASGQAVSVLFQPHVVCAERGILESIYARPLNAITPATLRDLYEQSYAAEPFVRLVDQPPTLRDVAYSNFCDIYPTVVKDKVVIFAAIDNLTKGAAGQAVQNMNIICGLPETTGLL